MQNIELEAMKCYENNLTFLSKSYQHIFKKIQAFEEAISDGDIKAKYDLEYKDGYFDVKDIKTNSYLYNTDSLKYSKHVADNINYKKDSFLFTGILDYYATQEQIEAIKKEKKFTHSNIKDVLPIMNYAMKLAPKTTTMKEIDKFIFIGVGLGIHIPLIDQKINSTEYLIIEDDFELFRLSLFTTPYYDLASHSNIHFSIAQTANEFTSTMANFLEGSFFNNRYLKYHHFPAHSEAKIKLIQNNLASQTHHIFPYDIQLDKYLRPLKRIKAGCKTLNVSKKFTNSIASVKPILVLAAGPSMKKNMEWIKGNQDKFIIVAVSAILKTLHDNDITPDIVTHIDGVETEGNSCMVHFEGFNVSEYLKNTMFVFGPHAPDALLNMLNKEHIFFMESFTFYYKGFGSISTPCVGSTSVILSLWMNAKEIYLLGLDLALDPETGETHSGDHEYNIAHDLSESDKLTSIISLRETLIPTKGNFRPTVYSTPLFYGSVQSLYNNIPAIIDESQTIYNLNDGAYLEGTTPIKTDDINTIDYVSSDKEMLSDKLLDLFNDNSKAFLDDGDTKSLEKRLENAKMILNDFQEYSHKDFTNENNYLYDLLGVVSSTLKVQGREGNNLALVFSSYFQYTLPYIMDIVNTKEMTKTMKHLQKIDKMFIDGAYTILNRYIEEVEEYFK